MKRCFVVAAVCAIAVLMLGSPALAHGERESGELSFTVGWANEPALLGQTNAVQLMLERDGSPVEGAEDALRVSVSIGDETTDPLELRTVFDSPGEYRADLIPTVVGGYTFRFTGTLDGEKVDESFTSPKDGFDEVKATSDIAFPKAAPTNTELAERLDDVDVVAADAKAAAGLPRTLAIVAIALAVVALVRSARPRRAA